MKFFDATVRSLSIAVCGNALLPAVAQAKQLDPETLRKMGEASAIRVSCGIGFNGDMTVIDTSSADAAALATQLDMVQQTATRSIGALGITLLTLIAIRIMPKHRRDIAWSCTRALAFTVTATAYPLLMMAPNLIINDVVGAFVWACGLITLFAALRALCGVFNTRRREVTVAVTNTQVIFRHGSKRVTRPIPQHTQANDESAAPSDASVESCAAK